MDKLNGFGEKIAKLRRSHGITQDELGKQLSVSAQAVSKWENGDSLPDLPLIVELAEIFDCSTDYLLGRSGGLSTLLPQIHQAFAKMAMDEKIEFLSGVITATAPSIPTPSIGSYRHPALVDIYLGPTGIGLWAKDRISCIVTPQFLEEALETLEQEAEFPLTLLPDEIRPILIALLRDMDDLKPDYAMDEITLKSYLPDSTNFDRVITESIELGFVDRVRGGYRLNFNADLAVRLLVIIHQAINKRATMNVTVGKPD